MSTNEATEPRGPAPLHPAQVWLHAARPKTLGAAFAPVFVAAGLAWLDGVVHWPSLVCALTGAILIQIGTNFANDYFDFVKGADTRERVGPLRVTQAGLVSPETMRRAMILTFSAVLIPGAYIIARGGMPFVVIGLLSVLFGVLYTGGPYPLGYHGLGDAFVLIFFGPVAVGGTYYLQAHALHGGVFAASLAPGLIAVALLTVNNLRDIDGDRAAGKRTLAVRFGAGYARIQYVVCIIGGGFAVPLYFYAHTQRHWFLLVALVVMFLARPALMAVFVSKDGRVLNAVLARTGKMLVVYGVLFALACAL